MDQTLQPYEKGGYRFQIRPNTSDVKGIDEVMGGGYRRTRPFVFDVQPGEQWIDFGAMIGAFSAYAIMKGAAKVFAVEPDPDHVRILKLNAAPAQVIEGAVVTDAMNAGPTIVLNRNDKRGNTWRNSVMRTWQGGTKVEVKAWNVREILDMTHGDICIKMDIEGMEMPILEWLLSHPDYLGRVKKLAFEWSFDVDADLDRFRAVLGRLKDTFPSVAPDKTYDTHSEWPKSWFPACTTIFCSRV